MPLVKIDLIKGVRSPEQIRKLADVVQDVMLAKFNAPPRDRYQVREDFPPTPFSITVPTWIDICEIITQHEPYELICEDTNLPDLPRTDELVIIHIFQQGRSTETKQATFAALAKNLESECGLKGSDLIISCSANTKEDWSFGNGRAQFLTGEL